ncbi:MAG: hypothetical protein MjAS7_1074 [Metallosphaera javensis (ex Sakai et al. 2022)]|nr:MAG: hypothetical protein MjAS7_1074 [Metallosphaera javensis (ex Sakai et al. 2022)]
MEVPNFVLAMKEGRGYWRPEMEEVQLFVDGRSHGQVGERT